jgi:hypothetical protein
VTIRDANGNVVSDVISLPLPSIEAYSGAVTSFYRKVDGVVWRISENGTASLESIHNGIFFLTSDCTGPAYVGTSYVVGAGIRGSYASSPNYVVSNSIVASAGPRSGYDPNVGDGTQCLDRGTGSGDVRLLTPLAGGVPAQLAAPFTVDR